MPEVFVLKMPVIGLTNDGPVDFQRQVPPAGLPLKVKGSFLQICASLAVTIGFGLMVYVRNN